MIRRSERRREAQDEAARLEARLTAFGELLAAHPFAFDRPDATHEMAAEYARALDAYEAVKREASRDPAQAGRGLDEGMAALNRLNALLVGTAPPTAPAAKQPEPKPTARRPEPEKCTPRPEVPAEAVLAAASEEDRPSSRARQRAAGDRAKPRLRDRYTSWQLVKRTGITAAAVYLLIVAVLGPWYLALVGLMALNFGGGMAALGGFLVWVSVAQIMGALRGGLVGAEYTRTTKRSSPRRNEAPYQQHYVYVDAGGEELTYQRDAQSPTLAALPTRRLWLVKGGGRTGMKTHLSGFWGPLLTPLLLVFGVPLFLIGSAAFLYAFPGLLIVALGG